MSNTDRHPKCHMRTALGNCVPIGVFCTSVNELICEALHKISRPQGEWIDDCISIQQAVDALIEWYGCKPDDIEAFEEIIKAKAVPSADRPQEWIPCSEKLPEESKEVLMSLRWGIDIGEYRDGEWHSEWINHYDDDDVLAWQPLPTPWKGADDE